MNLPFSMEQFFRVFHDYNTAVWPLQIVLYALAAIAIVLTARKDANRIISAIIAFLWAWMGIVYHIMFFARINPAAYVFGIFFLIEAFLIFWFGVRREDLRYSKGDRVRTVLGSSLILYALLVYPLLNIRFRHMYPYSPTFGAPCPTTIFTIGIFVFLDSPFPKKVLIIPALWCAIGATAALWLRVPEDFGLAFAGFLTLWRVFGDRTKSGIAQDTDLLV